MKKLFIPGSLPFVKIFYAFNIVYFSVFFSISTYSSSSKLIPTTFVINTYIYFRLILFLIFLIAFFLLALFILNRKFIIFKFDSSFTFFLIFQIFCLSLVIAQQGMPRLFTDTLALFVLPIILYRIRAFILYFKLLLLSLLIVSMYSILQFSGLEIFSDLPIISLESSGARMSGFLGINSNACYLSVVIALLDVNLAKSFSSEFARLIVSKTLYNCILLTGFLALIMTGSRAAIFITLIVFFLKRRQEISRVFSHLVFNRLLIFSFSFVFLLIFFLYKQSFESCYACAYIFALDKASQSLSPRLDQLSVLLDIISNPLVYLVGTTDLFSADTVGDNPWLEYTLDYGLIYTFSLFFSYLFLAYNMYRARIFRTCNACFSPELISSFLSSLLFALLTIVLLMLFYDSPQSTPSFMIFIILYSSFYSEISYILPTFDSLKY